jgi:hypothetical protein
VSKPDFNGILFRVAEGSVNDADGGAIVIDCDQRLNLTWVSGVFRRGKGRHESFRRYYPESSSYNRMISERTQLVASGLSSHRNDGG